MSENGNREQAGDRSGKKRKGFAAMDPEKVREIASMGGKTAQERGVAHRFTAEEARAAGKKGGLVTKARKAARGEE